MRVYLVIVVREKRVHNILFCCRFCINLHGIFLKIFTVLQNKRLQLNKELDDLRNKLERVAKQVSVAFSWPLNGEITLFPKNVTNISSSLCTGRVFI